MNILFQSLLKKYTEMFIFLNIILSLLFLLKHLIQILKPLNFIDTIKLLINMLSALYLI